ncbi:zinc-ribbon domain-containing protein [Streptococcus sanguinis]|uniref:Zinc-ribbon domain-containing protein n=1 Tax=Streptococcus sanguinis TaxID=1305 RepID=A0A7Y0VBQ4_STRSA|nr:zinc-ribbon domain-containing protein [Streptococcus sanguinis]
MGYKGYQKTRTDQTIECANCHNVAPWDLLNRRKLTLWIPTFPYGRKHYLTCPVCQHGKQIEKQEIEQFLNY